MRYREVATGALVDADQIRPQVFRVTMRVRTPAGVVAAVAGDWLVGRRDGSVEVCGWEDFDARFVAHVAPERPVAWSRKTRRAPASAGVTKQKGS